MRTLLAQEPETDGLHRRLQPLLKIAPWVLRVTEHSDKPMPVLIAKERLIHNGEAGERREPPRTFLKERGLLYGASLRRCLPVVHAVLRRVTNSDDIPLELYRFLPQERIVFRGNLPLDEEAGAKLALIFRLQDRLQDLDRAELIARRVERFSREEALYWLTRVTQFGEAGNRWAQTGLRIMLGGQPGDRSIEGWLQELRQ